MNILLPELLGEIATHVDNIVTFTLVCNQWHNISKNHVKLAWAKHFASCVPESLLDAFGNIKGICTYQVLTLNQCSDYIDFIDDVMMTSPIMIGIDPYKRRFFCVRYYDITKERINVVTIFQRYTAVNYQWNGCGHYNPSLVFDTSYGNLRTDMLKEVVNGKEIEIEVYGIKKRIKLI